MTERICSIEGCGKKHLARGWCSAHYWRWKRHGDPLGGEIKCHSLGVADDGRPFCEHGPMNSNGHWVCGEKNRARSRRYYEGLDGLQYSAILLRIRRRDALARMKNRHQTESWREILSG